MIYAKTLIDGMLTSLDRQIGPSIRHAKVATKKIEKNIFYIRHAQHTASGPNVTRRKPFIWPAEAPNFV